MLVRDKRLCLSGLSAISEHAAAPVRPELIPVPSVPRPVHKLAAKNMTPSSRLSVSGLGTTNNKTTAIIKQKMMGVSIIASLTKVNDNILLYACTFLLIPLIAAREKILKPMAGPILPIPIQR